MPATNRTDVILPWSDHANYGVIISIKRCQAT